MALARGPRPRGDFGISKSRAAAVLGWAGERQQLQHVRAPGATIVRQLQPVFVSEVRPRKTGSDHFLCGDVVFFSRCYLPLSACSSLPELRGEKENKLLPLAPRGIFIEFSMNFRRSVEFSMNFRRSVEYSSNFR